MKSQLPDHPSLILPTVGAGVPNESLTIVQTKAPHSTFASVVGLQFSVLFGGTRAVII